MKICVFGADGYIGSSVYQQAQAIKDSSLTGTYLHHQRTFPAMEQLNVNDPEAFSAFYKREDPDVVIWSMMSGYEEDSLIEDGLIHLIDHLQPETKLIYLSTDFVFGDGDGPYFENDYMSKLPEDHIYSRYNHAKVKAEHLICNELTNYAIVRAGPIYGGNALGKWDERTEHLLYHLRSGRTTRHRDDLIRTFIHVQDLAQWMTALITSNKTGVYHVDSPFHQSCHAFMQKMAKSHGFSPSLVKKDTESEPPDGELPKNTTLHTTKTKAGMKQKRRRNKIGSKR